jgi:hypothetical protein
MLPQTNVLSSYEHIEQYIYLESMLDKNGGSTADIRRKIALGRETAGVSKLHTLTA